MSKTSKDYANFMRSKNFHEKKSSNFSSWSNIADKNEDFYQTDDKYSKKVGHDRSRSVPDKRVKCSTSIPQNLSNATKRGQDPDIFDSDDIDEIKKSLKIMTKKLNVSRKEKAKAFEELKKEKERSKRFENDAKF